MLKVSECTVGVAKKIRMLAVANEMTIKDLAAKIGTSQPNLAAKLKRDNFSEKELIELAEACNAKLEINFVMEDGTKI